MSGKYALIIGNTEYIDPGLAQLTAPGRDAREFARVLDAPDLCAFDDVSILFNENASKVAEVVDRFFSLKKPDDLLIFYFSGHGVRDEYGSLYLAVKNTNRSLLRSTAIKSDFIREAMDQCRSRRQVLILDCCNSGAFAQGAKGEIGGSVGTAKAFEGSGYGRVILTASDATQFAWEGDKILGGESTTSLFTHFLVKGLEGEADWNGDGIISVDELYDYAYGQIVNLTPKQTPGKWSYREQGEIILRRYLAGEEKKPRTEDLHGAPGNEVKQASSKQQWALGESKARATKKWVLILTIGIVAVLGMMALGAAWTRYRELSVTAVPSAFSATSAPTIQPTTPDTPVPKVTPTTQDLDSEFLIDAEIILADNFDEISEGRWTIDIGEINDGVLEIIGNGDWAYVSRNRDFGVNEGVIIDFKNSADSSSEIFLEYGIYGTDAYRRFGIYLGGNQADVNIYAGTDDRGGGNLSGNLALRAGTTYSLLIAILPDGEFMEVIWDPANPNEVLSHREIMDESWVGIPLSFWIGVTTGTIRFDNFREIKFSGVK